MGGGICAFALFLQFFLYICKQKIPFSELDITVIKQLCDPRVKVRISILHTKAQMCGEGELWLCSNITDMSDFINF